MRSPHSSSTAPQKLQAGLLYFAVPVVMPPSPFPPTFQDTEGQTDIYQARPHPGARPVCGAAVVALKRLGMGKLYLPEDLAEGECRELTAEELALLQAR